MGSPKRLSILITVAFTSSFALISCGSEEVADIDTSEAQEALIDVGDASGKPARSPSGYLLISSEGPASERYGHYLAQFTEGEEKYRMEFFDLDDDHARDVFVEKYGLRRRWQLSHALQLGMTQDEVRAILGDPNYNISHISARAPRWLYEVETGYLWMYFWLQFREHRLEAWGSFSPLPEQNTRANFGVFQAELDYTLVKGPVITIENTSDQPIRFVFKSLRLTDVPDAATRMEGDKHINLMVDPGTTKEIEITDGQWVYEMEASNYSDVNVIDAAPLHRYRLQFNTQSDNPWQGRR
ncbi:MAG: hypothetical protein NUW37_00205 [Planctomycetes bacterium]|nr:hypothetical protein [Planctomycetota bacterium]